MPGRPISLGRLVSARARAGESPTLRERLRRSTAATHQTLHEQPCFVRLVEGRMDLFEYRALLARLYGFHWQLESGLRATSPEIICGLNLRRRERSPALRADLCFLGMTCADIDALPLCDLQRPVSSTSELLGRLYVVEGAGLGGRVLASKLNGLLGDDGPEGRSFFIGRAAPDPLPWPVFCAWLEVQGRFADIGIVIESAEVTFRAMACWLAERESNV
jgi:heme oxygenase